jgi:hypothetical protein
VCVYPNFYNPFNDLNNRATSEQVMDPRTRLILFKLLSNGFLNEIGNNSFDFQFKKKCFIIFYDFLFVDRWMS